MREFLEAALWFAILPPILGGILTEILAPGAGDALAREHCEEDSGTSIKKGGN